MTYDPNATIAANETDFRAQLAALPQPNVVQLPKFKASLANGTARWLMAGDSLTAGVGAEPRYGGTGVDSTIPGIGYSKNAALPAQVAQMLNAAGLAARGDAFFGDGNSCNGPAATNYGPTANVDIVFGADSEIVDNLISFGGEFFVQKAAKSTFTPRYAANRFDFYYFASGGNGPIVVEDSDGTVLGTVDTTAGSGIAKATISRSANTAAPIRFASAGGTYFIGLAPRSTLEPRIELFNVGISGGQSQDFTSTSQPWSPGNSFQVFSDISLATIQLGQNERAKSASQYRSDMEALIALVKLRCPNADIQLIKTHLSDGGGQDVQADKFAALDAIATAQNLATPIAFNTGVLVDSRDYNDPIHLAELGYRREAAKLVRAIATRI